MDWRTTERTVALLSRFGAEEGSPKEIWWAHNYDRIVQIVRNTVTQHADAGGAFHTRAASKLTPEVLAAVERHYAEILDLKPPGKAALGVFRPMWPMTLAQLRAMAADTRTNPTPQIRQALRTSYMPRFSAPQAMRLDSSAAEQVRHLELASSEDYRMLFQLAWKQAMPEGFPPYPRRGGVYNREEAELIRMWLFEEWPVIWEIRKLLQRKDIAFERAGVSRAAAGLFHTDGAVAEQMLNDELRYNTSINAEGKTPKELLHMVLEWARRFLPKIDALLAIDPKMLTAWPDPDAHLRAVEQDAALAPKLKTIAERVYGMSHRSEDWARAIDPSARAPLDLVSAHPDNKKTFPLSYLLQKKKESGDAYTAKLQAEQAATNRARVQALPVLRALAEANKLTRAQIEKQLPTFPLRISQGMSSITAQLFGPPPAYGLATGHGPTIGAALQRMLREMEAKQ